MSHCAENHPESSPVEWFVSFWNVMASAKDQGNYWEGYDRQKVLDYWTRYAEDVKPFTEKKNYKRIEDKPVLQHGYVHTMKFYQQFDVSPEEITCAIRSKIPDAYLLATATERDTYPLLKSWGFDAFTEYLLHNKGWDATMETYRWSWAQGIATAKKYGLDYWVPATSGYDGSAWDTPESKAGFQHVPTPEQFTAHLKEARQFAWDNRKYTRNHVLTYSLNEFAEQKTPIEPTVRNGDRYLIAHKQAAA